MLAGTRPHVRTVAGKDLVDVIEKEVYVGDSGDSRRGRAAGASPSSTATVDVRKRCEPAHDWLTDVIVWAMSRMMEAVR